MMMKKTRKESWFEEVKIGSTLSFLLLGKNPSIMIDNEFVSIVILQIEIVPEVERIYMELIDRKDYEPKLQLYHDEKIIEEESGLFDE